MNEAAKIAARLTLESLSSLQEKLDSGDLDASELITPDVMRFIKEAQDRAHGTPTATIAGDPERPVAFASVNLAPLTADDADD